jgi:hypothetical protein
MEDVEYSYMEKFTRKMKQRRVCFLTGKRIGLPIGIFVALKILFGLFLFFNVMDVPVMNLHVMNVPTIILHERDSNPPCISTNKKQLVALLLSIFLGELGVDQFYIGNIGLGVGKLLTCGGCGIWWLVDVILFAINDHYTDKNGCQLQPI